MAPRSVDPCIDNRDLPRSFLISHLGTEDKHRAAVMAPEILFQRLTHLAKHRCACASLAKKKLVNPSKFASTSCYSTHTSIPDFLLPAFSRGLSAASTSSHVHRPCQSRVPSRVTHVQHHRNISTSPAMRAVVVTANPRKDVDGNEMLIDITTRAANVCGFSTLVYLRWRSLTNDLATQRDNDQRSKS